MVQMVFLLFLSASLRMNAAVDSDIQLCCALSNNNLSQLNKENYHSFKSLPMQILTGIQIKTENTMANLLSNFGNLFFAASLTTNK